MRHTLCNISRKNHIPLTKSVSSNGNLRVRSGAYQVLLVTVNDMIASIFLLFFAFGITLASLMYGGGGVFPVLVALSAITIVTRLLGQAIKRRAPQPILG